MRYQVFNGSISSHCCFEATVIDTEKPEFIGGEHYMDSDGRLHYESVCECFSIDDAQMIADSLNAVNENK